MTIFIKKT